jgi:hypothetical protein
MFGQLSIVSREHFLLMSAFLAGNIICWMEIGHAVATDGGDYVKDRMNFIGVVMVVMSQVCLIVMLLRFEQIDILQQLEREVVKLTKQNEAVEGQRERMKEFWSNCQQLTELWLYRTVPRLDLYKEIHSQLEDQPPEHLIGNIESANHQLENLEQNLGALETWRKDGDLKTDSKKQFGREINQLCQEQEFDNMLRTLQDITSNSMKALAVGDQKGAAKITMSAPSPPTDTMLR